MPNRKPRVLIADDDMNTRIMFSDYLTHEGYETIVAADGAEALALAAVQPPDIALVDVRMPGPSGMALVAQLKERQPDLEAIIITAYGSAELAVEVMFQGAFYYLDKPLEMSRLLEKVEKAWAAQQARVQVRVGELVVDLRESHATLRGEPVKPTPLESRLLLCLARRRGRVVSHETLWRKGWGHKTPPDENTIWMAMSRLRRKIGAEYIGCVKGRGYLLQDTNRL